MQATKQREVQSQEERYVIECMSSCEAYTCAVACDSQRVRSLFVWSIEPLCGDKGLHSLDALSRTVELPIGHAKYTKMACRKLVSQRQGGDGDIVIVASSRKLLELWRLRMSGDLAFYTCIELTDSPHNMLFSSCGTIVCCCEGRTTVSLRSAQTLETVAVLKQPGDEVTGISFSSRGDIIAMHKSFGENSGQDDTVVICCDSGRVAAWGVADLLNECQKNISNNRIAACEATPALLLEYNLACKQGPCGVVCVSRSLTMRGQQHDAPVGNKKSSYLATNISLILLVCDRDSKLWLLEANAVQSTTRDYCVNGDSLPYVCREVRCLDLERETRYFTSPRRMGAANRDQSRKAPGGRNRATPVKLRPTVSGPTGNVNMSPAVGKSGPAPAVVSQKPTAGALLSMSLFSSIPVGASLPVVTNVIILTQTSVLSVNMQTFRLDANMSIEIFGLSALAFASAPKSNHFDDAVIPRNGTMCPLSLLPAFDRSKFPYVYIFSVAGSSASIQKEVDRSSPSPKKAPPSAREKAMNQEQISGGLGIFSNRPLPSWALSSSEKNEIKSNSPRNAISSIDKQEKSSPISSPISKYDAYSDSNPHSQMYSFFTSSRPVSEKGDAVDDDLRIGLPANSPLLAVYRPPPTPDMHMGAQRTAAKGRASGGSWEAPKVNKSKGKIQDMPVTFHDRVKSSGYGQNKPKQLSFAAKAKQKPSTSAKGSGAEVYSDRTSVAQPGLRSLSAPRAGRGNGKAAPSGKLIRSYPMDCYPCDIHQPQNDYPPKDSRGQRGQGERRSMGPLHGLQFSEDGAWVGVVSQDSAVETLKTPVGKNAGSGLIYCGHDSGLNGISFSHDNSLMLSASKDGTARMWRLGRVEAPAVIFSHRQSHPRIGGPGKLGIATATSGASAAPSRNKPYGSEITTAQFFHMDRFVMLTSKSSVYMYSFEPEGTDALNDIKRLQSYGKYKLVAEYNHQDTHRVSALSCINSVQSVLCISATADRKLHLLDAAVGAVVKSIDVAHDKAVHCIALPQPSVHCRVEDPQAYNMFATASTDNSILLWDIRTPNSVCRYSSHVNRREAVNCCLSPCMRYLATGSEDRTARIVDLRTGMKEISKIGSGLFRDVVTGVAYHPIHAQLGVCSFDGTVKFFRDGES